jgi:hypothetical protein
MKPEIQNILNKIEANGYEAYVVGGFVRDYYLGIETEDVDICTNALPKDVLDIFNIKKETTYGSISFKKGKYNFDITTYRKENDYVNRKPQTIEYTNNLILDIKRRDFTINSLCMNSSGQVFDYLNGLEDINNKIIRVIGQTSLKLTEDPLRILRAIRLAIILDFKLDEEIISFIKDNKILLKSLSYTRKKEELDKIFSSKNVLNGLNFLKELDLLSTLEIEYDKIVVVPDLLGIWAQINFSEKYPFTKNNLSIIKSIRKILEVGKITNYTLFKEGLYISLVAGEILGYDKKQISQMYHNLKVKSSKDLVIKPKNIIDILNIKPSFRIKMIYEDILNKVIDNKLDNDYEKIKMYILNNWK